MFEIFVKDTNRTGALNMKCKLDKKVGGYTDNEYDAVHIAKGLNDICSKYQVNLHFGYKEVEKD